MRLILVKSGQTLWDAQSRLESVAGTPLTDDGRAYAHRVAGELADKGIKVVYASAGESQQQTAEILGESLHARVRVVEDLVGMNYGLWQGLLIAELKRRHMRTYKQFMEAPGSICPPEGETLGQAQERLEAAMRAIARRHARGCAALVLRGVMVSLAMVLLDGRTLEEPWKQLDPSFSWVDLEVSSSLALTARTRE
jgi:broad specificity phosphatase PhoE